jgi:hypothetical protein
MKGNAGPSLSALSQVDSVVAGDEIWFVDFDWAEKQSQEKKSYSSGIGREAPAEVSHHVPREAVSAI